MVETAADRTAFLADFGVCFLKYSIKFNISSRLVIYHLNDCELPLSIYILPP